jgi:hypothetical protein
MSKTAEKNKAPKGPARGKPNSSIPNYVLHQLGEFSTGYILVTINPGQFTA